MGGTYQSEIMKRLEILKLLKKQSEHEYNMSKENIDVVKADIDQSIADHIENLHNRGKWWVEIYNILYVLLIAITLSLKRKNKWFIVQFIWDILMFFYFVIKVACTCWTRSQSYGIFIWAENSQNQWIYWFDQQKSWRPQSWRNYWHHGIKHTFPSWNW